MRLCIVFPNPKSQSETFIANHVRELQPFTTLTGGWCAYRENNKYNIFGGIWTEPLRIIFKRAFPNTYDRMYTHFLAQFLQKRQITHLLAEYGVTGVKVMQACKQANVKLIVHFHGFDASNYKILQKYSSAYQTMFHIAHKVIVVSEDMQAKLLQLQAPRNKVLNIPYGIDLNLFSAKQLYLNQKIVISVGRLTAKKSPILNIKAFNEVVKSIPEAQLWIIGEGELRKEAECFVKELGLGANVKFWGYQKPTQIANLLQKADVFIQHSITDPRGDTEGTPNTILEASASGLPVVSTLHAGIKQAVEHGKTGFLVKEGDYLEMAKYIVYLLEKPSIAKKMGQAGRQKMQKEYNLPIQIAKLRQAIFEE